MARNMVTAMLEGMTQKSSKKPIVQKLLRPLSSGHPNLKLIKPSVPYMNISATNQLRQLPLAYRTDIAYLEQSKQVMSSME